MTGIALQTRRGSYQNPSLVGNKPFFVTAYNNGCQYLFHPCCGLVAANPWPLAPHFVSKQFTPRRKQNLIASHETQRICAERQSQSSAQIICPLHICGTRYIQTWVETERNKKEQRNDVLAALLSFLRFGGTDSQQVEQFRTHKARIPSWIKLDSNMNSSFLVWMFSIARMLFAISIIDLPLKPIMLCLAT